MWTMKKFLYCLELESGGRLVAGYCAVVNILYIFAMFSIYQHMEVKKVMDAGDEIKALGLAAFINFMIYYIVGSLLMVVGISERKYKTMLFYLKVHGTMTVCISIVAPAFNFYFGTSQTMLLVLSDGAFRWYSLGCVYSLYEKFKYETREREKMEASEKAFASYGTVPDAITHYSEDEESTSRAPPPNRKK